MADEPSSIWMYNPSFALAILASVLYGIVFIWIFYLTVIKYRAWFFTCVVIGAGIEVAGYALRCYSIKEPTEIQQGTTLLIGRLIQAVLDPTKTGHRVFGVHGRLITRIFVICDVISFLVQCSGSSVASSTEWVGSTPDIGVNILIGGLVLQAAAFVFFMCIFSRFHYVAKKKGLAAEDAPAGWERVVVHVYISSILILIRCIYRVAEFSEGVDGYAFLHEWMFWIFESVPMLIAIGISCILHPSAYLGRDGARAKIRGKAGEINDPDAAIEL